MCELSITSVYLLFVVYLEIHENNLHTEFILNF